jgi:hypothetical protein
MGVGVDQAGGDCRVGKGTPLHPVGSGDPRIRADRGDSPVPADQDRPPVDRQPVDRQHPPGGQPNGWHLQRGGLVWAGGGPAPPMTPLGGSEGGG